jgi:hypothetical protein
MKPCADLFQRVFKEIFQIILSLICQHVNINQHESIVCAKNRYWLVERQSAKEFSTFIAFMSTQSHCCCYTNCFLSNQRWKKIRSTHTRLWKRKMSRGKLNIHRQVIRWWSRQTFQLIEFALNFAKFLSIFKFMLLRFADSVFSSLYSINTQFA